MRLLNYRLRRFVWYDAHSYRRYPSRFSRSRGDWFLHRLVYRAGLGKNSPRRLRFRGLYFGFVYAWNTEYPHAHCIANDMPITQRSNWNCPRQCARKKEDFPHD